MKDGISLDELKKKISLVEYVSQYARTEARGGEHWACCPLHEEKTASFAIKNKNGIDTFYCQGCGKGGSIIDFIELKEHVSTRDAIEKLKELVDPNHAWREQAKRVMATFSRVDDSTEKKSYPLTQWTKNEEALDASPEAVSYLEKVRGISKETAKRLRFGYTQTTKAFLAPENEEARDGGWILLPRIVGDKIVAVKLRSITHKAFAQIKGMDSKALYNVETINPLEPVFVTEGEYDTAIMEQAGFCAVSIPNATTRLTPEWKMRLKEAQYVVLAGDNDGKAGSEAMNRLREELGENAYLLLWPDGCKDANDFFRNACEWNVDIFRTKVEELVKEAKERLPEGFSSLMKLLRTSTGTDGMNDPYRLHFGIDALDRMAYVPVDAGYVIFYSTYSGTGKSVFTTQTVLDEALRGEVVCVYSPEISGPPYLSLVVAQTLPERNINRSMSVSQDDYRAAADVLERVSGGNFQYYVSFSFGAGDPMKTIEEALNIIRPSRFVIDTFPCVVTKQRGESTSDAEARTACELEALGKKYGCLFIIVGQSNKEADDLKEKRKDSHGVLRGSRVLFDKACAIFLLHRKKKENPEGQPDVLEDETLVQMEKNRFAGPGAQSIKLLYVRQKSRFFLQEKSASGNVGGEPQEDFMNPQGGY